MLDVAVWTSSSHCPAHAPQQPAGPYAQRARRESADAPRPLPRTPFLHAKQATLPLLPLGNLAMLSMGTAPGSSAEPSCSAIPQILRGTQQARNARLDKIGSYKLGKKLGNGNFATVRVATHEVAKTKVAVKIIDRSRLDAENLLKVEREIQILQTLRHPHIVKLYEVIRTDKHLFIVSELATGGELFDLITFKGKRTEAEARKIFQQISAAVAYCHANGVVHRDLKAENVLLDKTGNIKLADFGFSNYQTQDVMLTTWCGSPPYAAPELLLAQPYDGRQADVWSLGVVLFILVTAEFPFQGASVDNLKMAVLGDALNIPYYVSVECADLLRKMLTVPPEKRITMTSVLNHRWFTQEVSEDVRPLLHMPTMKEPKPKRDYRSASSGTLSKNLDPTVLLFMQQHTIWSEEKIAEDVLMQNYESPVFATYALLNDKLDKLKQTDQALLADDQPRRGSRGSIISGKAKVDPEPVAQTIPAHHLAQLNLSMTDYDSDESMESGEADDSSRQRPGGPIRHQGPFNLLPMFDEARNDHRRHTLCASGQFTANPFAHINQQLFFDPTQQLHQQQQQLLLMQQLHQQNLMFMNPQPMNSQLAQQAMELNSEHPNIFASQNPAFPPGGPNATTLAGLMCLRNGLVDYSRMMRLPNSQERRASANEALLGLNSFHVLAAQMATANAANGKLKNVSPTRQGGSSILKGPDHSVEEEGAIYLSRHGTHKRNTVHGAQPTPSGLSVGTPLQPQQQTAARHAKTPYAKANGNERRSSWASTTNQALVNSQQFTRLESLYAQSLRGAVAAHGSGSVVGAGAESQLTGIQQLQAEFQRLKASTERNTGSNSSNVGNNSNVSLNTPRISITDENNKCLLPNNLSSFSPLAFATAPNRPATVMGLTGSSSPAIDPANNNNVEHVKAKFIFIPVPPSVAVDRIYRFVRENDLICEVRQGENVSDATEVRVATKSNTIVGFTIHKMLDSQNISKTEFAVVRGDLNEAEQLRSGIMEAFNEVR